MGWLLIGCYNLLHFVTYPLPFPFTFTHAIHLNISDSYKIQEEPIIVTIKANSNTSFSLLEFSLCCGIKYKTCIEAIAVAILGNEGIVGCLDFQNQTAQGEKRLRINSNVYFGSDIVQAFLYGMTA